MFKNSLEITFLVIWQYINWISIEFNPRLLWFRRGHPLPQVSHLSQHPGISSGSKVLLPLFSLLLPVFATHIHNPCVCPAAAAQVIIHTLSGRLFFVKSSCSLPGSLHLFSLDLWVSSLPVFCIFGLPLLWCSMCYASFPCLVNLVILFMPYPLAHVYTFFLFCSLVFLKLSYNSSSWRRDFMFGLCFPFSRKKKQPLLRKLSTLFYPSFC